MIQGYTVERNFQILIRLLREHGISRIIASPGSTNIPFVASVQQDSYFKVWSCVDERSAAYMACGMAAECGEPVVLSCTGATASRNYLPGLTEAYYRNLPILAVTTMQRPERVGQLMPQVIDRANHPNDVCRRSFQLLQPHDPADEMACNRKVNEAILELGRRGGGPVHLEVETRHSADFSVTELPKERVIRRHDGSGELPEINSDKIGVFVGAHRPFSEDETNAIELFCTTYGAVVICDQTSNYRGNHRVLAPIVANQDYSKPTLASFDLMIHLGQVSGAYMQVSTKRCWRVSPDGEVRDTFGTLTDVFEMSELSFFYRYTTDAKNHADANNRMLDDWKSAENRLRRKVPELPFSNLWMAQQISGKLPKNSALHLGILNSLRSWNMFETPRSVTVFSNTGGFGIDGALSTAIGAALASQDKTVILVLGDLAFFYDMNALGNRDLPKNLRILLVNNGLAVEFKNYSHFGSMFGDSTNAYISAAGHFGSKSRQLVRDYATDLNCEYHLVTSKAEFNRIVTLICDEGCREKPLFVEAFTNDEDESEALKLVQSIEVDSGELLKDTLKGAAKKVLGAKGSRAIKAALGKG